MKSRHTKRLTALSTLGQGKELHKTHEHLERARHTVRANEQNFASLTRALQDTVRKWEVDWKGLCNSCQDLEEERMGFTKDNMWCMRMPSERLASPMIRCVSLASRFPPSHPISSSACEMVRLALEPMEVNRDLEIFVRDYGTVSQISNPPVIVDYSSSNTIPSSGQQITPAQRPGTL